MANEQRRAGLITLKTGGEVQDAKGDFTYNLGIPKREAIIGADGVHGYKETPQVAFIEGAITDRSSLNVGDLALGKDLTITLELANGKTIVLRNAFFAGDGNVGTGEGEIAVRWESKGRGREIS
jgi:hypothetical protein